MSACVRTTPSFTAHFEGTPPKTRARVFTTGIRCVVLVDSLCRTHRSCREALSEQQNREWRYRLVQRKPFRRQDLQDSRVCRELLLDLQPTRMILKMREERQAQRRRAERD
ncbi:hypothetical protein DPX16_6178 [Anabarilius grahami]|uniref:Uncharacterized protein n=1 Tax=Anabarilius grahami TaxID=495550 RepID=A0A3N0Z2W3_ANAGA|nr:hypothetical protein DPX16_6178 [Anabarilius grahami]